MKKKAKSNKKNRAKMTDVIIDISFDDERWEENLPEVAEIAEQLKTAVFGYVGQKDNPEILRSAKPLLLHLSLSNDGQVRELNRDFRGLDKPTNVLSFANIDSDSFGEENIPFDEIDLGNIIIAYETTLNEAEAENITMYAHFCHLLVHGMLHILGFDHQEQSEAELMEGYEKEILAGVGIADPYENFE